MIRPSECVDRLSWCIAYDIASQSWTRRNTGYADGRDHCARHSPEKIKTTMRRKNPHHIESPHCPLPKIESERFLGLSPRNILSACGAQLAYRCRHHKSIWTPIFEVKPTWTGVASMVPVVQRRRFLLPP